MFCPDLEDLAANHVADRTGFAGAVLFKRSLAPRWRYALNLLVLVRLALPVVPAATFSIFNLANHLPVERLGMGQTGRMELAQSSKIFHHFRRPLNQPPARSTRPCNPNQGGYRLWKSPGSPVAS